MKSKVKRPRVRFCFDCGHKLWGNYHRKLRNTEDGLIRTFHAACAKEIEKAAPELWEKVQ